MGRKFTSPNDRIYTGTAGLNGLNFTYGTFAMVLSRTTDTGTWETLLSSNNGGSAGVTWGIDPTDLFYQFTTSTRTMAGSISTATHYLLGASKSSGNGLTPRGHRYEFATNTWTHADLNGGLNNAAATTAISHGCYANTNGTDPFDGEIWAIGLWHGVVMSDSAFERLARGNWLNYAPSYYEQYSDGREVGHASFTLGRFPARQTARSGTSRGLLAPPPGFRMCRQRRRR